MARNKDDELYRPLTEPQSRPTREALDTKLRRWQCADQLDLFTEDTPKSETPARNERSQ